METIKNIQMQDICIVSSFDVIKNKDNLFQDPIAKHFSDAEELEVYIFKTKNNKCLRCWQYKKEVDKNDYLCTRCKKVINELQI